jgi:hypothetical protein
MAAENLHIAQQLGPLAGRILDRARSPLVQFRPVGQEKVLIHYVVDKHVGEPMPGPAALAHYEVRVDENVECPGSSSFFVLGNGTEHRLVERLAKHGRALEYAAGIAGKLVDARKEKAVQGRRNIEGLATSGTHPTIVLADERAAAEQAPNDLFDEQWIAARLQRDHLKHFGECALVHSTEKRPDERLRLV